MADDQSQMPDVLARISIDVRADVAARKAARGIDALRSEIATRHDPPRGFGYALKQAAAAGDYALIAEIKKASPSGGLIRPEFDPPALARAYQAGGAACLSVLTERAHFQGDPAHLKAARAAVDLPVLRKDFMLDPWQVYESRAMGADCILLIMAALTDAQAREMEQVAMSLDLDVLVEVHDREELDRALLLETSLIGINNRNLKTMVTDLAVTEELGPLVPPDRFLIAESGIRTTGDLRRLASVGATCYLVGESLMRQDDVTAAVRTLLSDQPAPGSDASGGRATSCRDGRCVRQAGDRAHRDGPGAGGDAAGHAGDDPAGFGEEGRCAGCGAAGRDHGGEADLGPDPAMPSAADFVGESRPGNRRRGACGGDHRDCAHDRPDRGGDGSADGSQRRRADGVRHVQGGGPVDADRGATGDAQGRRQVGDVFAGLVSDRREAWAAQRPRIAA
jgi:indole-3-glycerol phosphate synthase